MGVYDTTPVLYPDIALKVATAIAEGRFERGILLWDRAWHGDHGQQGPRHPGRDLPRRVFRRAIPQSNNCQILTMGAVIGPELAKTVVDAWLRSSFRAAARPRRSSA